MSGKKLSSRQQAMVAVLETFPAKFANLHRMIEEMTAFKPDEAMQRRLARTCDEMKAAAAGVGAGALADTLGMMGMIARRTGGLQTRLRGLREGLGSLKINYESALKAATTADPDTPEDAPLPG